MDKDKLLNQEIEEDLELTETEDDDSLDLSEEEKFILAMMGGEDNE